MAGFIKVILETIVPLLLKWFSEVLGTYIAKKQKAAEDGKIDEANRIKLEAAKSDKEIIDSTLAAFNGTPP